MEEIIAKILPIEWEMFHSTQNIGGQASCQRDREQFEIMRRSQFAGWNEECLKCYLADVEKAWQEGGNLPTLKYAYMMESTSPEEYQAIADTLPPVSEDCMELVKLLTAQTVRWCEEFAAAYPHIAACGRPVHRSADSKFVTSVETYSRGEFMTYGKSTLEALWKHYQVLAAEGRNLHREVIQNEVTQLGYASLDAAEASLANRK